MASFRSWFGGFLATLVFFCARRIFVGSVAPLIVTTLISFVYAWVLLIRVPEWKHYIPAPEDLNAENVTLPTDTSNTAEETAEGSAVPASVQQEDKISSNDGHIARTGGDTSSQKTIDNDCSQADACIDPTPDGRHAHQVDGNPASDHAEAVKCDQLSNPQVPQNQASNAEMGNGFEDTVSEAVKCDQLGHSQVPQHQASNAEMGSGCEDTDSEVSLAESERRRQEEDALADPEKAAELKQEGNALFKAGQVHDAREAYSEALHLTPSSNKKDRAILHCNRAACMQKLQRWEEVVSDCKAAIDYDPEYTKAYCRRSTAFESLEKWHDSLEDLKKAIELEPSLRSKEYKRQAFLEARTQEQFEKDKDEMMGKLKELGNTVLGKFGMSCDNFKFEQDPNTGGYSVKFQN